MGWDRMAGGMGWGGLDGIETAARSGHINVVLGWVCVGRRYPKGIRKGIRRGK